MARPSRALSTDSAPAKWFWQPDPAWLNTINMTNIRSLNAVRIAVFLAACGAVAFFGTVLVFWRNVWMATLITESANASAMLLSGREAAGFAKDIFEALLWFATAMGGFAVAGVGIKRATDTQHRVAVEQAKKAPVVVPPVVTTERQAPPPQQSMTVNVEGDTVATKPAPTGDARVDDERGE